MLYNVNAIEKGLVYLYQLIDKGTWRKTTEMYEEFGIEWLEYRTIIEALPKEWKKILKTTNDYTCPSTCYENVKSQKKVVKYVYNTLVSTCNNALDTLFIKMSQRHTFNKEQYAEAFVRIHYVTNITKYRDFQYRLLVNDIHANDKLYHWKKVETQRCDWCEHKQTVKHLFWECKMVEKLWNKIENFINKCLYINQEVKIQSYSDIFLGTVHVQRCHIINLLVLVSKHYIYTTKCKNQKLSFYSVLRIFDELYKVEKYYSKQSDKERKHEIKWKPYVGNL